MSSGVYRITNIVNGKQYIGSAANFKKRWEQHRHLLTKGAHHSKHLQLAWNKYGEESFRFEVLHECLKENAVMFEQMYIDEHNPEYNMAPRAGSNLGLKLSDESRAKISAALSKRIISDETRSKLSKPKSKEHKAKIRAARIGTKRSAETRAKIGAATKGNTYCQGRQISDETRNKMSAAHKGWVPWNKGKTLSNEHKAKMSVAAKNISEETRAKMSASQKARYQAIKELTE